MFQPPISNRAGDCWIKLLDQIEQWIQNYGILERAVRLKSPKEWKKNIAPCMMVIFNSNTAISECQLLQHNKGALELNLAAGEDCCKFSCTELHLPWEIFRSALGATACHFHEFVLSYFAVMWGILLPLPPSYFGRRSAHDNLDMSMNTEIKHWITWSITWNIIPSKIWIRITSSNYNSKTINR